MAKRRAHGEGTIYQRADGRWAAQIGRTVAGRRHRQTIYGRTQGEVRVKLEQARRDLEDGMVRGITVSEWMKTYLDTIAPREIRPRTLDGYRSYTARHIVPTIGDVRLESLTPAAVRRMDATMATAGLSAATRRQAHAILRRALKFAVQERLLRENPASLVSPPSLRDAGHHREVPRDEALQLLRVTDDPGVRARCAVALLTGLRQGEALALRWSDVDLDHAALRVERSVSRVKDRGLIITPPKTRASIRTVPLVPPVVAALAEWKARSGGVGYVWPSPAGVDLPLDPSKDAKVWRAVLASAGLPHYPLHGARATTATLLAELRVPPQVIADILGQATVRITADVYMRSDERQRREAMAGLGSMVTAALTPPCHDASLGGS